jgi:hypothetical protein
LKVLGLQTSDFSASYDLIQALRARGIPFISIAPGEPAPAHVGAIVTTAAEVGRVSHRDVIVYSDVESTLAEAKRVLNGIRAVRRCVIGIDPGERPGVAILADGRVLRLIHARSPEAVRATVDAILASVPAERFVVRVGNGAPTSRDRILNTLAGLPLPIEIVDETNSTPASYHGNAERDTAAATRIALTPGTLLAASDVGPVRPTEGELRDIQRKSRLASEGKVTISRVLARRVALGRLTLDEAVKRQSGKA